MKTIITTTALIASLAMTSPALAKNSQKFTSTVTTEVNSPVKVEVIIGKELAYMGNHLARDSRHHSATKVSFRSGFSDGGYYGERDLNRLADRLEKKLEHRLSKNGITVDDTAGMILRMVITDAKPNRPTFTQLSKSPGLSMESYGVGGAAFEGEMFAADGRSLGKFSYGYYDNDIRDAEYSVTWSDAHRAMDRFARNVAKSLN